MEAQVHLLLDDFIDRYIFNGFEVFLQPLLSFVDSMSNI
jgi:hypothetical protein